MPILLSYYISESPPSPSDREDPPSTVRVILEPPRSPCTVKNEKRAHKKQAAQKSEESNEVDQKPKSLTTPVRSMPWSGKGNISPRKVTAQSTPLTRNVGLSLLQTKSGNRILSATVAYMGERGRLDGSSHVMSGVGTSS